MPPGPEQDPRVYFAAERTFLAWIRTGLALMGVGFAVARFGLFLRQMRLGSQPPAPGPHSTGFSVWSGVALVVLGILVNLAAVSEHLTLTRQLAAGTWVAGRVSRHALALAILLALAGLGMAIYLLAIR